MCAYSGSGAGAEGLPNFHPLSMLRQAWLSSCSTTSTLCNLQCSSSSSSALWLV